MHPTAAIGILGGGAWGTALALVVARAGRRARLWLRDEALAADIAAGANPRYLPGVALDPAPAVTTRLSDLAEAAALLVVVPTQALRPVLLALAETGIGPCPLILCCKGVERESLLLPSDVAADLLPGWPVGALSGPSFAAEVARGQPTAVTLALDDAALAATLAQSLASPGFRPYPSDDPIGVEVGGAVKNVLAIAAGIAAGRGLGANAEAALVTRGLAEIARLACALGGRPETPMGLAGLGDLILTCRGSLSRNFAFGRALGAGEAQVAGQGKVWPLVEGALTAEPLAALAARHGVEMPICAAVDAILGGRENIDGAIRGLIDRPLRLSHDWP